MQTRVRSTAKRAIGAAAIALTAAGTALAIPATASAATPPVTTPAAASSLQPPVVTAAAGAGNVINVTVQNPNPLLSASACFAAAVDAKNLPAILSDPTTIVKPGTVAWSSLLQPALPGQTQNLTTPKLPAGVYAVLGGCDSVLAPTKPVLSAPQFVLVGDPLSAIGGLFGSS